MAHVLDSDPPKRKRDVDDAGLPPPRQAPAPCQPGSAGYIQYVPRPNAPPLKLVQGDGDTFYDIVGLIGEYETVLDRQESFASNLGAKLTGPRLLRGIEKFFDGPIKTTPLQAFPAPIPITWLDVISFARASPNDFAIVQRPDGSRWCRFVLKSTQVEITEDDWRLLWSGALDRFPLDQPLEEDESAELATLEILEQRTSILYKKADEVAARARILNHRLGQRRQEMRRRRNLPDTSLSRYQPASQSQRSPSYRSSYDLHADLLQQFSAASSSTRPSRSDSLGSATQPSPIGNPSQVPPPGPPSRYAGSNSGAAPPPVDLRAEELRSLIAQRLDQLAKGDLLRPPCDRCRRLRADCTKYLTACHGCTKKHAKCSWKAVTDEEIERLKESIAKGNGGPGMDKPAGMEQTDGLDPNAMRIDDRSDGRRGSDARTVSTDEASRPSSRGAIALTPGDSSHPAPSRVSPGVGLAKAVELVSRPHEPPPGRSAFIAKTVSPTPSSEQRSVDGKMAD